MQSTSSGSCRIDARGIGWASTPRCCGVLAALLAVVGLIGMIAASGLGCTAVQQVPKDEPKAYLRMQVEPASAEIYVDGDYKGTVEGWVEGAVPMAPGEHRVKLTADGYIARRFDVELEPGESKILELDMERRLETFSGDAGTRSPPEKPKSPLETESSLPGDRRAPDASGGETSD